MSEQPTVWPKKAPASHLRNHRAQKSERRREEIVAAATRVLNERTYALATMSGIAAELDLRDATLYHYFPSKQAMLRACHDRSMDRFAEFLVLAEAEGGSGADMLVSFLRHFVELSDRDGPLLYFGDYQHLDHADRDAVAIRAADLTARLERLLILGVDDGSITPCEPRLVVQLLLGMLIWLAKWVSSIEDLTADRLLDAIASTAMSGLDRRSASTAPKRGV